MSNKNNEYDLEVLVERFDSANEKILNHPNFNDEAREAAMHQSATYMMSLDAIIKASDGTVPDDALPVLEAVSKFLDLVERHCAS